MSRTHFAFMLLINFIWGFFWVVAKFTLNHFPPMLFTAIPFLMLTAVLFPFLKFREGQLKERILTGLFLGPLVVGFIYFGLAISNASVITIAANLGSPFSVVLSVLLLREKIVWWRAVGIICAFSGVIVLSFDPSAFRFITGLSLATLGAFLGSIGVIIQRQLKNIELIEVLAWVSLLTGPVMLGLSLFFEHGQWNAIISATPADWGGCLYVAFLSTLIGDVGYWYLIRRNDISRVAPYMVLNPIFGVTLSVLFLGDALTSKMLIGAAVALSGVFILSLPGRRSMPGQIPPIEIDREVLVSEEGNT